MGIYRHLTDNELRERRDSLLAALERAATAPASVSHGGRSVTYHQSLTETRRLLDAVRAEIARRSGQALRRPIYLV